MRHSSTALAMGFLAVGFWAAAAPRVTAAPAQDDRDLQEVQSYRLSMDVVRKLTAVYKAMAAAEAKDPKRQQIAKKKAELKALESKQDPTDAEQERMASLADEIARLEERRRLGRDARGCHDALGDGAPAGRGTGVYRGGAWSRNDHA